MSSMKRGLEKKCQCCSLLRTTCQRSVLFFSFLVGSTCLVGFLLVRSQSGRGHNEASLFLFTKLDFFLGKKFESLVESHHEEKGQTAAICHFLFLQSVSSEDPHILTTFEDPVFDPELNQSQYKHNGKARKGDGNDITPNPNKLNNIGKELKKLTRVINDITLPSELPTGVRPKTRKEKNKLASR